MRRTSIGILSLLFALLLFAVPASAFDLPQCAPFPAETTHFALIAEDNIIFEPQSPGSGRVIEGNVLVTSPTSNNVFSNIGKGFIRVGANTTIDGTVIAHTLLLPDGGATITQCIANVIVANTPAARASCGTGFPVVGTPFTQFIADHPTCQLGSLAASDLCGPTPATDACVNGKPKLTVGVVFPGPGQAGLVDAQGRLKPDCYGALQLEAGAVLNLAPGTFTFASVKMNAGSKLIGPATVNVNREFHTEAGVFITDINLNIAFSTTAEVAKIFNNSTLTRSVINAPLGKCHLHTGTALLECSEACCKILDVQPITAECDQPRDVFCPCPTGFRFLNPWQLNPNVDPGAVITGDLQDSRTCVRCLAGEHPPAFPTCPPAP